MAIGAAARVRRIRREGYEAYVPCSPPAVPLKYSGYDFKCYMQGWHRARREHVKQMESDDD